MKIFWDLVKETQIRRNPLWVISLALSMAMALLRILSGYLYEPLVGGVTEPPHLFKWDICFYVILVNLLLSFGMGMVQRVKVRTNLYLEREMTSYFIRHFNQLDGLAFDQSGLGPWLTLLLDDIKECSYFVSTRFVELIMGLLSFLFALVYGLGASWQLTVAILIFSFIGSLLMRIIGRKLQEAKEQEQTLEENLQPIILQIVAQVPLIKALKSEGFIESLFEESYAHYREQQLKRQKHRILLEALSIGLGFVMTTSWVSLAFFLILYGELTLGQLFSFMIIDRYFTWVFFDLPTVYSEYLTACVCAKRILTYKRDHYIDVPDDGMSQVQALTLTNVSFSYGGEDKALVLKDLSVRFDKGSHYALTGASGSGKSTLLKVLAGIYTSYQGIIEIDGARIADGAALSAVVSYVPQDNVVMAGTLRENILLGRHVNDRDLEETIERSGLTHLVKRLEQGLDTEILSGTNQNLSEGEIQRIGFARAVLKKADFLLLDEPTASLDADLETILVNYYSHTDQGVLVATHRDSSVPSDFLQLRFE